MPICAGTRCYFLKVDIFFPQLRKAQQCTGNKIFSVFSFPKNAIKAQRLSVYILNEKKRMKRVHLGRERGLSSSHSPVQQLGCELVVLRPPCYPALVLSSLSPPSLWDVLSLDGDWQGSLAQSYKEQQSQLLTLVQHCSYLFCFPQRQDRTDDCGYFKMSAWHCGISII